MAITLLVPTSTPRRCYLMEALLWAAVNRFPLSSRTVEGGQGDDRENIDYLDLGGLLYAIGLPPGGNSPALWH
jgi:hypothetical protein